MTIIVGRSIKDAVRIADLVEVCVDALDVLLGVEQITSEPKTITVEHNFNLIRDIMDGGGACSIRDLRAVIAKATKPVGTEEKA